MRALAPLSLAVLLSAIPFNAAQASSPRVALVVSNPDDEESARAEARLRAELLISGFEVLTVPRREPVPSHELADIANESGSVAAVSIVRSDRWLSAEIWLSSTRGGPAVIQQVRPEPISRDGSAIVAIRAAEVLRASGIDLRPPPAPVPVASASESAPLPEPPAASSSSSPTNAAPPLAPLAPSPPQADKPADSAALDGPPTLGLTAAICAAGGPGGVPAAIGPSLAVSYAFAPWWAMEFRATGPLSSSVSFDGGAADLDQELLAVALRLEIDTGDRLTPSLTLGGGAYRMGVRGHAAPPQTALSDSAWSAAGLAEAGIRFRASPRWAVRSALGAMYASARPVIAVDDQAIAYAASPQYHGSVGLELGW